jgi:hypothetical protein
MKKQRRVFWGRKGTALKLFLLLFILCTIDSRLMATTYGGAAANTTFYSNLPVILNDGDNAVGFVNFAGGFHATGSVTFTNIVAPVANDIYLTSGAVFNVGGDLTLSTTSIAAGGGFSVNASGNTLFLAKDTTLPAQTITLASDLVIDGQGQTLTFNGSTVFALGGRTLTLKNMVLKGLTGSSQFSGNGTLILQNCIIDLAAGTTVTYGGTRNLTITDDVVIQGGETFQFTSSGTLTINEFSTMSIDYDTIFDYAKASATGVVLSAATSTIHINGGTLKVDSAVATAGLLLETGRLLLEGRCLLDNLSNSDYTKGIFLGDLTNDLDVRVLPGARVEVNGCVTHKANLAV